VPAPALRGGCGARGRCGAAVAAVAVGRGRSGSEYEALLAALREEPPAP
jgi:hypothetical protein